MDEHPSAPTCQSAPEVPPCTTTSQEMSLLNRLEAASANFEDVRAKTEKMERALAGIAVAEQIHAPSSQFRTTSTPTASEKEDNVGTIPGVDDLREIPENLMEPVPVIQQPEEDINDIVVVGDIVPVTSDLS